MTEGRTVTAADDLRMEWREPVMQELSVLETAAMSTRGGDGGATIDCSRS